MEYSVQYEEVGPYFEIKYTLSLDKLRAVQSVLDHYFVRPNQFAKGSNLTLYYDTPDRSCYADGLDGSPFRQKVRFRRYLDQDTLGTAIFEFKEKNMNLITKRRFRFAGGIEDFPTDLSAFIQQLPPKEVGQCLRNNTINIESLEPSALITYDRYRYLSPFSNVRINLDVNIKSEKFYLFTKNPKNQQYFLPMAVLELKSEDFPMLPDVLKPFLGSSRRSLSKYVRLMELGSQTQRSLS